MITIKDVIEDVSNDIELINILINVYPSIPGFVKLEVIITD